MYNPSALFSNGVLFFVDSSCSSSPWNLARSCTFLCRNWLDSCLIGPLADLRVLIWSRVFCLREIGQGSDIDAYPLSILVSLSHMAPKDNSHPKLSTTMYVRAITSSSHALLTLTVASDDLTAQCSSRRVVFLRNLCPTETVHYEKHMPIAKTSKSERASCWRPWLSSTTATTNVLPTVPRGQHFSLPLQL